MKAVIFDMDGVLIDSEEHWRVVEGEHYRKLVPTWSEEDRRRIPGMSVESIHAHLRDRHGVDVEIEQFRLMYDEMDAVVYKRARPRKGLVPLLDRLRDIQLAVATSSRRKNLDSVLDGYDIRKYFVVTVSADDIGGVGKPAPDIFLETARRLGIPPEDCVVIEDSQNGILAAKAAGMRCVGVEGSEQDLGEADAVVRDLTELDDDILFGTQDS